MRRWKVGCVDFLQKLDIYILFLPLLVMGIPPIIFLSFSLSSGFSLRHPSIFLPPALSVSFSPCPFLMNSASVRQNHYFDLEGWVVNVWAGLPLSFMLSVLICSDAHVRSHSTMGVCTMKLHCFSDSGYELAGVTGKTKSRREKGVLWPASANNSYRF